MANQLRQGAVGAVIRVRLFENGAALPASTATVKTLKFQKPSGTVISRPAVFETDGSDGRFLYTTVDGDLDESGPWVGQMFLELASGKFPSEEFSFNIAGNLG
jgi:hypothetical protein